MTTWTTIVDGVPVETTSDTQTPTTWDAITGIVPYGSAADITYTPAGTGAINTTVETKLRDLVSVTDFGAVDGSNNTAAFALAVTGTDDKVIVVPYSDDDTTLPADYSNVSFEYYGDRVIRNTHVTTTSGTAKKALKTQLPSSHSDSMYVASHIEAQALGSGKNGPDSADYGLNIALHKKGYAGTSDPTAGEIDGLSIFVRQDGPKGTSTGDANSSDAAAILCNVQNVEDAGYICILEATTSNYDRTSSAIVKSIQTQIGVLDQNQTNTPSYGFITISTSGDNTHAIYISTAGAGTWDNILFSPNNLKIDADGNYYALTTDWTAGAWSISRPAGENAATTFLHRGTGAMLFYAQDASAIQFGVNGSTSWQINSANNILPTVNLDGDIGSLTKRVSQIYALQIDLGSTETNGINIITGGDSPEGVKTANVGSLYLRRDGGANTTLYVKESGTGNTGWVAK